MSPSKSKKTIKPATSPALKKGATASMKPTLKSSTGSFKQMMPPVKGRTHIG